MPLRSPGMGAKQSIVKAAGKGDMERVQHHLKKRGRAALFEKEPGGWTALHKAARKGRLEMVEYLIENMADIESIDAAMMTPLHCACWKGHADVVSTMLERGASPFALTESGWNPIHTAAFRGHDKVVKVLLGNSELSMAQRDLQGFTALELTDFDAVAELLEQAGFNEIAKMMEEDEQIYLEFDGEFQSEFSAEDMQAAAERKGVDIFAMLGLRPDATPSEVKQAYKRLAGKYAKVRPSSAQRNRPSSAEAQQRRKRQQLSDGPLAGDRVEYAPAEPPKPEQPVPAPSPPPEQAEEDVFEKMEQELVERGYGREAVRKSLGQVGYSSVADAEVLLREWGHAPKTKGAFMRKWKGGDSSQPPSRAASSLSTASSRPPGTPAAPTPAPPTPDIAAQPDLKPAAPPPVTKRPQAPPSPAVSLPPPPSAPLNVQKEAAASAVLSDMLEGVQGAGVWLHVGGRAPPGGAGNDEANQANGDATRSATALSGRSAVSDLEGGVSVRSTRNDVAPTPADSAPGREEAAAKGVAAKVKGRKEDWEVLPLKVLKQVAPKGWKPFQSTTTGKIYWYHKESKQTCWDPPDGHPSFQELQSRATGDIDSGQRPETASSDLPAKSGAAEGFRPTISPNEPAAGVAVLGAAGGVLVAAPPAAAAAAAAGTDSGGQSKMDRERELATQLVLAESRAVASDATRYLSPLPYDISTHAPTAL